MPLKNCTNHTAQDGDDGGVLSVAGLMSLDIRVSVLTSANLYTRQLAEIQSISEVCFILQLYFSLYDFHSVQPRVSSTDLCWTVVEYHSQSYWTKLPHLNTAIMVMLNGNKQQICHVSDICCNRCWSWRNGITKDHN